MARRMKIAAWMLLLGLPIVARGNVLINGGLETSLTATQPDDLVYASPSMNSNALPGWTITSGTVDIVPNSYFQAAQGNFSVDLIGTPGIGSIAQTFATTPGDLYRLTFEFSVNPENKSKEKNTTKVLQVEALGANGSSVLASQTWQDTVGTRTRTNMEYQQKTFTFTADGTSATLTLAALAPLNLPAGITAATAYCGPVVDGLDLEDTGSGQPPAPEPASLGIVGAGAILLVVRRGNTKHEIQNTKHKTRNMKHET